MTPPMNAGLGIENVDDLRDAILAKLERVESLAEAGRTAGDLNGVCDALRELTQTTAMIAGAFLVMLDAKRVTPEAMADLEREAGFEEWKR